MDITELLFSHLKEFSSSPFLFIGSGISRRYLGLENWSDLLKYFAKNLAHPYEYYFSKANGVLPVVASLIAPEFHSLWWSHEQYSESRNISIDMQRIDSPLKFEIAKFVSNRDFLQQPKITEEIDLFRKSVIDGIITTNWDPLLERLFPDFQVYSSQEELLFSTTYAIAEIYKIHGDCSKPNSLVITSDDYANFEKRNAYLASKLLTLFVEHPVIFLGYRLADPNIQAILHSIANCTSEEKFSELKNRLIFVRRHKDSQTDSFSSTLLSLDHKTLPVTLVETNDFGKVYSALARGARKFPAKILRKMKNNIYDIVLTNDRNNQMRCLDIDKESDSSKVEIVYGVGVIAQVGTIGYEGIHIDHLLKNVILGDGNYIPQQLMLHTIPQLLRTSEYVPVFKYLREMGYFDKNSKVVKEDLPQKVKQKITKTKKAYEPGSVGARKQKEIKDSKMTVFELLAKHGREKAVQYAHYVDESKWDLEDIRKFLAQEMDSLWANQSQRTYVRKLVCLYDFLKYGPAS